jgi:phospholipase C
MATPYLTPIRHVIVLMFENRSFDHLCGWFGRGDGLTPAIFNREDPADPTSPEAHASRDAEYVGDLTIDPGHALTDVNEQLFGATVEPTPPVAINSGFVSNYARRPGNTPAAAHRIMHAFDPVKLPVLSKLAAEFVLCDRWFASVPGQTWPNRFFVHAATSGGFADNQFREFTFRTVYERLDEAGYDWAVYFHDFPHAYTIKSLRNPLFVPHFRFASQFFADLKHGHLPAYSFIEPRYFDFLRWKANDFHPPHDVRLGEHLTADVYEALRRSSAWSSSLLVVLFDEHGGLFDHVPPPAALNPDGKVSVSPPFGFDRLGPRVPAIIVSPRVARGGVDSTVYDHSSIVASLRGLFAIGDPLGARDGAASTLLHLLQPAARDDAPRTLPRPAEPTADRLHEDGAQATMTAGHVAADMAAGLASSAPLSEFQRSLVETANALQASQPPRAGVISLARLVDNEHEGAVHVRDLAARLFDR